MKRSFIKEHTELGKRIRVLRTERGWSLTHTNERTGISRSYLAEIEKGRSSPTYEKLLILADAFEIRIADLLEPLNVSRIPAPVVAKQLIVLGQEPELSYLGADLWLLTIPDPDGRTSTDEPG